MSWPGWKAPDKARIEGNKPSEPEGERLRAELTEWLTKNKIVGILMDTPEHHVDINYGPNLPPNIKLVLHVYGGIYVKDE